MRWIMGGNEKDNRLAELLNMERLQNLLDNLAKALGLAFVAVDYRGRPVTQPSGFSDFCSCMRNHRKFGHLCNQCYAHGGLHATIAGKPCIYHCHGGLAEYAVPLIVDGKYLGAIMGGQCVLTGGHPDPDPILPQSTPWEEEPELAGIRKDVHKTTYEKLEASVALVQEILRSMLEEERCRLAQEELGRRNRELQEEKTARVNLELAVKEESDSGSFMNRLDSEHLFFMLNVISRLAFLEKAEKTDRAVCDFAAMMRYVLENGEYNCVTVGEELEYIDYYLQIQSQRMEGRLHYEFAVPEMYHSTLCPFMLLHPLVKVTVKYVMDNSPEGGTLTIQGREEKGLLVLTIRCGCSGMASQQTGWRLEQEGKRQGSSLLRMDQILKNTFGQGCGVAARNREDGIPGTEIEVRLPLQGGAADR